MPNIKILRVCLDKDLPKILDRDRNYLYLTCDKLELYMGQNLYYDPFIICEKMPTVPIDNYLYIVLSDCSVKALIGDNVEQIAAIENADQIALLREIGSVYFVHADKRYLDKETRTLQLPYHNGQYSMTVSMANDIKIDEKTAVRYDPETESFYIEGEHEGLPDYRRYKGKDSPSVKTIVEDFVVRADVKVSNRAYNLIKVLRSGLYAGVRDKISIIEFKQLAHTFDDYKKDADAKLKELQDMMNELTGNIDPDSILSMINEAIIRYCSGIDEIVSYFNNIKLKLENVKKESNEYTDEEFNKVIVNMEDQLNESPWGTF